MRFAGWCLVVLLVWCPGSRQFSLHFSPVDYASRKLSLQFSPVDYASPSGHLASKRPRRVTRSANNPPALWARACGILGLHANSLPLPFPDWPRASRRGFLKSQIMGSKNGHFAWEVLQTWPLEQQKIVRPFSFQTDFGPKTNMEGSQSLVVLLAGRWIWL